MLSGNITANLDNLASLGVINYDGAAYIAGSRPRFYGAPNAYTSPFVDTPMDYTSFSYNQNRQQPVPWWRTFIKGALALGCLYFGGKFLLKTCKGVKKLSPTNWFSSGKKTPTPPSTPTGTTTPPKTSWFKNIGNSISNFWSSLTKGKHTKVPGRIFRF